MRRLVCFDINETLLDMAALDGAFAAFGGASARQAWFSRLLQMAMASTLADRYQDFSALARASLRVTAARRGWSLTAEHEQRLFAALAELPPHRDAVVALERLHEAGFKVAALTNSAPAAVRGQLERCGLALRFDAILSVDAVRRYKPAAEPYHMAAAHFGLTTADVWMVAAHDWDILGAMAAGCAGAFIARDGARFPSTWPPPTVQADSLAAAAAVITAQETTDDAAR